MQITPYIIAVATVVPSIVQRLKDDPRFDFITPETKGRIFVASSLLTAIGAVAIGLQAGTIVDLDSWIGLGEAAVHFVVTFGLVELVYKQIVKRFQPPKPEPETTTATVTVTHTEAIPPAPIVIVAPSENEGTEPKL